jgi:hypothetical protein
MQTSIIRTGLSGAYALSVWLAAEQSALAQGPLAQGGVVKTMIGWMLVLLAIGLGLLVVCRPSGRKSIK